jgi:hypothetical protein
MINKPMGNPYSIEVDTRNEKLRLFKNDELIREYTVWIDKVLKHTFKGTWRIIRKLPAHKEFGGYFMSLNIPYGMHGIHKVKKSSSELVQKKEGSIKVPPHEARELYMTVPLGTAVVIY